MSDYIERSVIERLLAIAAIGEDDETCRIWARAMCIAHITPTADVAAVRHGKWLVRIDPTTGLLANCKCLCCGKVTHEDSDYCPNCGAKMDKTEDKT